jgi:hypothetical protein
VVAVASGGKFKGPNCSNRLTTGAGSSSSSFKSIASPFHPYLSSLTADDLTSIGTTSASTTAGLASLSDRGFCAC